MPVLVPSPPPVSTSGPPYDSLYVVDMTGKILTEIQNAQITQVTWQLNNEGELQFLVATDEPSFAQVLGDDGLTIGMAGAEYEVQYFRRGQLYWWGVLVDTELQGDGSTTQVTCYGLLWYAHKRFFGQANRVNWLEGYSLSQGFAQPVTKWTAVSTYATFPVPANPVIGQAPFGTGGASDADIAAGKFTAVQLAGAGSSDQTAGEDAYYETTILFNKPANGSGNGPWTPQSPGLVATAYYTLTAFTGPAANFPGGLGATMRGLWMTLLEVNGSDIYLVDGNAKSGRAVSVAQITTAATVGTSTRLQVGLIPPNRPFQCRVRLYAPGGKIQWSGLSLVQQDGYYPGPANENVIVQRIAQIGLQPSSLGSDNLRKMDSSKTDLKVEFNCPHMSQVRSAQYPYANHQCILDALTDWTTEYEGVDMEILFPDAHHRVFTTWGDANKGRKGVFQPALALNLDPVLAATQFSVNSENGASNVVEIGVDESTATDQGSANIEGGYIDPSVFGGKDIEIVETAPADIAVGALGPFAQQREQSINGAPLAPVIRTRADDPTFGPITIGSPGLHVGDTTRIFADYGWMQFDGTIMRVVQIDLYPSADGDVVDFTCNLPDPYAGVPSPV